MAMVIHDKLFDVASEFGGSNGDSATHHIVSFFKLVVDFNIYHEDDLMTIFAWTVEGDARLGSVSFMENS